MSYVYDVRLKIMNKSEKFDDSLQILARFTKVLSHPARLAILKYLAAQKKCISGDISGFLPLGRTTVSQHLSDLKEAGLISGEVDGLKVNYCLCNNEIKKYIEMLTKFFRDLDNTDMKCC